MNSTLLERCFLNSASQHGSG